MGQILDKKNFLLRAFHPYGHAACNATGLVPASMDVMEKEIAIAEEIFNPDVGGEELQRLFNRATWYMEAAQEMVEGDNDLYDRDLRQDLVHFYMAMKAEEHSHEQLAG